jgi:hypothetical protein
MYYSADAFKGVMLGTPSHYGQDALVLLVWSVISLIFATIVLHERKAAL